MSSVLMNINEPIPDNFYIFVSYNNLITANNLGVNKHIISSAYGECSDQEFRDKYLNGTAQYLPFEPCLHKVDCHTISPFLMSTINDYRVEYDAEKYRAQYYSTFPSRLSAIFAFGDYETCKLVAQKYNWSLHTIKKFKLLPNPLMRVVKVDMEIVSLARLAYRSPLSVDTINIFWDTYWSGKKGFAMELAIPDETKILTRKIINPNPSIFEYLIEGALILQER